jgi:hypothetical protein
METLKDFYWMAWTTLHLRKVKLFYKAKAKQKRIARRLHQIRTQTNVTCNISGIGHRVKARKIIVKGTLGT